MTSKEELANIIINSPSEFEDAVAGQGEIDLSEVSLSDITLSDVTFNNIDFNSSSFADSSLTEVKFID